MKCGVRVINKTDVGYYLRSGCGGAAYYDVDGDGTASEHMDMMVDDADYIVTNNSTQRINPNQSPTESSSEKTPEEAFGEIAMLNFANNSIRYNITLVKTDDGTGYQVAATNSLQQISGYEIHGVYGSTGEFKIVAGIDSRSYRHIQNIDNQTNNSSVSIVIWPNESVTFEKRPTIDT
jgi:hypothetical protein